ncbi:hypothetical protein ACFQPA_00590 [Halomarina halobia]|uniref:Uncharacterized protein n=1 Tax=Halomarina halobia TaxID=3033386 RepID=A0ABD6A740_9EURY|nr:hypothetical protein [Halomarina sp. PSR21]
MTLLQAGPSPLLVVAVAMLAGFGAALALAPVTRRLPEGLTPAFAAASVLYGRDRDELTETEALSAHYTGGILAGVLFALAFLAGDAALPTEPSVLGVALVPAVAAALAVALLLYALFAHVAHPRFDGGDDGDAGRVRGDWAISVAVYVVALVVLFPVGLLLLT